MLKKILVPVDGSASSFRALEHAMMLGKVLDSEIVVAHIAVPYDLAQLRERPKTAKKDAKVVLEGWEAKPAEPAAKVVLEGWEARPSEAALSIAKRKEAAETSIAVARQKAEAAGYMKISFKEVVDVDPALMIVEQAEDMEADLIIMGSRGLGFVRSFLVGSVSSKVLANAPCAVTIVR